MLDRLRRAVLVPPPAPVSAPPGGLPFTDLYPSRGGVGLRARTYRPPTSVASTTSSAILAPANPARRALSIANDSTAILYLTHGPVSSSASFTARVAAGAVYVIEEPGVYQGDVSGAWAIVNGAARVTEAV